MSSNVQFDPLQILIDNWADLLRLLGYLGDPGPRITQLNENMNKLRCEAEDIKDRINSDERCGKTRTRAVRNWLRNVDAINEKVSKIRTDHENGTFRCHINHCAEKCLAAVRELVNDSKFDVVATRLPPNGVQEIHGVPRANPTMDSYLSQLQDFLQDDGSQIFGIWGTGGVGKTTLLKVFNNELFYSSQAGISPPMFDHVIFAEASNDYKLEQIQRDISSWLGLTWRKRGQAKEIRDFLENKSFLLLLDNLWQRVELSHLGIPHLTQNRTTKQKVVFTTRLEGVCGEMQAWPKMKVGCLNADAAWLLFQEKVGKDALEAHAMIPQLAQSVAKECDGLPLALVVIGAAMSTKKTTSDWQNALTLLQKYRLYEIQGMSDKILPQLKFSYDNLPNEIFRRCFLLCSLWPSISKTELIECWMGHGLVDEQEFDNINQAYDSGHTLIGELQAACLLEPAYDEDREVKMHDVVRDLALWIDKDCGERQKRFIFIPDDSQIEAKMMSFLGRDVNSTLSLPSNCAKLETLILKERFSFKPIVEGFFQGTPALTYLDLSYTAIDKLPQDIDLLRNLRYLNISHTKIQSLPMQLGNLSKLRFLLLRDLKSIDIPSGLLEKLVMLSVIDMTNTWCDNWKELSRLRGCLKGVGIVLKSIEDLQQLAQLKNVRTWRLGLRKLKGLNEPLQLLSPLHLGSCNICSSIQMLKIELCDSLEVVSMESHGGGDKCSLSRLEDVELRSLSKLKEIVWGGVCPVKMLPRLTVLTIYGCHNLRDLSWVIRLSSLEYLKVYYCNEMEQIVSVDNGRAEENDLGLAGLAFRSLKNLCLINLRSLKVFGGSFMFPLLETMQVSDCPKLKTLPFGKEIASRKLRRIWGNRSWLNTLEMKDDDRDVLRPYLEETRDSRITREAFNLH